MLFNVMWLQCGKTVVFSWKLALSDIIIEFLVYVVIFEKIECFTIGALDTYAYIHIHYTYIYIYIYMLFSNVTYVIIKGHEINFPLKYFYNK